MTHIQVRADPGSSVRAAFDRLGGVVEMPADRRFIVITVPVRAGFPAVEAAVGSWAADHDSGWEYGNVYDDGGGVLPWLRTA
ncbi:hypothetical protein KOI35_13585 [Actinoplanes bogorensis]|uniref:Uncharacterized protein n=1 Tax=Paractinoplanes bogorensis TaxID=1610840 RepID=A0ABS5YM43_9ACTN|nr:hypothetical protein [Actinoplanes bogorensis]MBU2664529.1 hypothetical protein [Actinoplanes bogorensis]